MGRACVGIILAASRSPCSEGMERRSLRQSPRSLLDYLSVAIRTVVMKLQNSHFD